MSHAELANIDGIPDEVRPSFKKLLEEPLMSAAELRDEVDRYKTLLDQAKGDWLDRELAAELTGASKAYLDHVWGEASEEEQHLIQAAIRYFVLDEDFGGDLESCAGFDDDQLVMNAVARHLGRDDMIVL